MKSKGPQVQERIQDETMGGEEATGSRSSPERGNKVSTGGMSSLDFIFLNDFQNGTDTLEAMTEPADEGNSTLEPPSPLGTSRYLPESSSPSNSKNTEQKLKLLME